MLNLSKYPPIYEKLKCCLCDKFLSVAPIYCNGPEMICGRCSFVNNAVEEDKDLNRQHAYEAVAKHMKFPCSNLTYGCDSQLNWNDVLDHENVCIFKKLNCPLKEGESYNLSQCRWVGSGPKLNEHLESEHSELISRKLIDIDFMKLKSSAIYFLKVARQLMIIVVKFEPPEKFNCIVMANGTSCNCEDFRYQLELQDADRKNCLILRRNRVEDAIAMDENLIDSMKLIEVDLAVAKSMLKNPDKIVGRFGILKKSKKEVWNQAHTGNDIFDENFLRELECPICKCYLSPPIYICNTGHSICDKCRRKINDCPSCRQPFEDGRNYALEKLTSFMNYPCAYRDAGCSVILNSNLLKEHEKECCFVETKCFLKCSGTPSLQTMFVHLNSVHADSLLAPNELHLIENSTGETHYFAMCFGNDIFRLVIDSTEFEDITKFSLQQYGVNQSNYRYEVDIVSFFDNSQKVSIVKECIPICADELENAAFFPLEMIQHCISDEDLIYFRINIRKAY